MVFPHCGQILVEANTGRDKKCDREVQHADRKQVEDKDFRSRYIRGLVTAPTGPNRMLATKNVPEAHEL